MTEPKHIPLPKRWSDSAVERLVHWLQTPDEAQVPLAENDEAWLERIEQRLDDLCEYWPEGDFKAAYCSDVALLTTEYRRLQFGTDGLVKPRFWFYKPGSWMRAWPVAFGNDEWCRKTIVLGNWLTGCIVIALWQMDDPDCPDCVDRRGDGDRREARGTVLHAHRVRRG